MHTIIRRRAMLAALFLLLAATASEAGPLETRCTAAKDAVAGKYAACVAGARGDLLVSGDQAEFEDDYAKCDRNMAKQWDRAESRTLLAGSSCPSLGDRPAVQAFVEDCLDSIGAAMSDGSALRSRAECEADLSGCSSGLQDARASAATCLQELGGFRDMSADLGDCSAALDACRLGNPASAKPLQTGQVRCWNADGVEVPCAGTGQDGELQKGVPRSLVDNGDGTLTDSATGLMWEKLSRDGSLHDATIPYSWEEALGVKVAGLNAERFAGHRDWRLPSLAELYSLVDPSTSNPAAPSLLQQGCTPGCSVTQCSCIQFYDYWTSTTHHGDPRAAWTVMFAGGELGRNPKQSRYYARAVRSVD